jgi:hypothetical protein
MRFLFKLHILKQGKQVCEGNRHFQRKMKRGKGMVMERVQTPYPRKKRKPLANIARKRDMMRTNVGSCILKKDQSGSKERRERKQ